MVEYNNPDLLIEIKQNNEAYIKRLESEAKRESFIHNSATSGSFSKKPRDRRKNSFFGGNPKQENESSNVFLTHVAGHQKRHHEVNETSRHSNSLGLVVGESSQGERSLSRRFYTELYPDEREFVDIFKRLEEDCLELMRQTDSLADDFQSISSVADRLSKQLEQDQKGVAASLQELELSRDELMRQLDVKKSQLHSSKKLAVTANLELSEDQKQAVYSKIFGIAIDMGLADRRDRKPSELNYDVAMDYLKQLTQLAENFIQVKEAFKEEDKKGFERETREYQSEKRDRLRYEAEIAKELHRVEDARLKKEREERMDRERGGRRKDMKRAFVEEVQTGKQEKEKLEEIEAKDNMYFRGD